MERLDRIDEHGGDFVRAPPDCGERTWIQIFQRETVIQTAFAPETRHDTVPPSVIRAREADDQPPPCVEAHQPHCRHHRFGAAHMEGHFVQPRYRPEHPDVVRDDRMHRSEDRTECLHTIPSALDPVFVALESRDIDAVGTADVQAPLAVEIAQSRPVQMP